MPINNRALGPPFREEDGRGVQRGHWLLGLIASEATLFVTDGYY